MNLTLQKLVMKILLVVFASFDQNLRLNINKAGSDSNILHRATRSNYVHIKSNVVVASISVVQVTNKPTVTFALFTPFR